MNIKKELLSKKEYILLILFVIIMSFVCIGSSPILDYMDPDSQNFRLLGRAMARGQIAYVDIFDHKGPNIFFIECIGALLSPHSEWGIFLIEVICYSINICLSYWIIRIFTDEKTSFYSAMAFLGLSFNFFTFVTGNLTDSYSVTFQIISAYFIIKYIFVDNEIEHPPIYMLVHGLMACICALMRPVNAGMWIPFGIVLAIRLFYYKKYRNFVRNLFMLVAGVVIGFAPAVIYGLYNNCLYEMWYGTIVANMQYAENASHTHDIMNFLKNFILAPEFLVVFLCFVSIVVVVLKCGNNWFRAFFITMFVGSLFFMNVSLRNDGQYNQLYMLFTIPAIVVIIKMLLSKTNQCVLLGLIIIATLIGNLQLIKQITKYGTYHYHYEAACDMKTIMDKEPGDKVLVTGTQSLYYNVTDTVPHIKYFIIYGYGLHYEVFPDATLMQADSILSGENDYVIVNYGDAGDIYGIQEIDEKIINYLADEYTNVYQSTNGINTVLYKRNYK